MPAPLIPPSPRPQVTVQPGADTASPLRRIPQRLAVAVCLVVFVALLAYVDRGGYADSAEDGVSLLDCFYLAARAHPLPTA